MLSVISVQAANSQLAEVMVEVHVKREDGAGTCGTPPWGVDHLNGGDFSCPGPKYWFGYHLVAVMSQKVLLIPDGVGQWRITAPESGMGTYRKAEHFSDGKRICAPVSLTTPKTFPFGAQGVVENGKIGLRFSASPEETAQWSCRGGHGYERKTTLLAIDWATALTGDYRKAATSMSLQDRKKPGFYQRQIAASMNPSPKERDFTTVDIQFVCYQPVPKGEARDMTMPCPWD